MAPTKKPQTIFLEENLELEVELKSNIAPAPGEDEIREALPIFNPETSFLSLRQPH